MQLEFKRKDTVVDLEVGSSILEHAEKYGIDLDHACGETGMENLSSPAEDESALLDTLANASPNSRLGCQARIERSGVVSVSVPE